MTGAGLAEIIGVVALLALVVYAVLGGADFGGGVWDLLARGPRANAQRKAIAAAMGPVWEANHVWLIFLIVVLFTAFPRAFAALSVALYWPFHIVLAGIVLRGAAFVFRGHSGREGAGQIGWSHAFGAASVVTPFVLGACLGAVSAGTIRVRPAGVEGLRAWIDPFPLSVGLLALGLCAYLAAVYLTIETQGAVQEDFRARALGTWFVDGILSLAVLLVMRREASWLWENMTRGGPLALLVAGFVLAPAGWVALWQRRFTLARSLAAAQIAVLLSGWALAAWPYVIYPDVTLSGSAAPSATLSLLAWIILIGMVVLIPSLWLLFSVFKARGRFHSPPLRPAP